MSAPQLHVKIGEVTVLAGEGVLFAVGLGSCVAVALYDRERRVGGLAHVMLPEKPSDENPSPGRYALTAVPRLVDMMIDAGADKATLFARIAGGAAMFAELLPAQGARLGDRNVVAVKSALADQGIPLHGEEVGGSHGRSVYLNAHDGSLLIRSVQRGDVVL